MKHPFQRVGVLVDVQNMYWSARNLYRCNVNFAKILEAAVSGRQLIRSFAYVIKAEMPKEKGFFEALEHSGFEVKQKDLQVFPGGVKKGDWDVGMAIDAVKIADHLDVIVLVTGDGDFLPLVNYLKDNKGCRVEIIAFGKSASRKLIESADQFTDLDENPRSYLIKA